MTEKCIRMLIYILFSLLWKNQSYLYFVLWIFSSAIPEGTALFFLLKDLYTFTFIAFMKI